MVVPAPGDRSTARCGRRGRDSSPTSRWPARAPRRGCVTQAPSGRRGRPEPKDSFRRNVSGSFGQVSGPPRTRSPCNELPLRSVGRDDHSWEAEPAASSPMGEADPRTAQDLARERQLSHHQGGRCRQRRQRPAQRRTDGDGQIERDALALRQVACARFTVIFFCGNWYPLFCARGEHAGPGVVACVVGKADEVEPGQPEREIDWTSTGRALRTGDRGALEGRVHARCRCERTCRARLQRCAHWHRIRNRAPNSR